MNNISIQFINQSIIFKILDNNLNNNICFTDDYILNHFDEVYTLINDNIIKNKISEAIIYDSKICEVCLKLINESPLIKKVVISYDEILSYTVSNLLLLNSNLEDIECYGLPSIMLNKFDSDIITTRLKINSTSNFMKINNINTQSDIFNKTSIIINDILYKNDVTDLIYFLNQNKNIKYINILNYDRKNLDAIISILNKNNIKKVNFIINENNNTTKSIIKDLDYFNKIYKKYNYKIRVKYSKEYKRKNKIKEFNINLLKYTCLLLMLIGIIFFTLYKSLENKGKISTTKSIDKINEIKETVNNTQEVINSTQEETEENKLYNSRVYSELLKENDNVVGWITVNNTNIDYPVLQYTDNEYYLNHSFDKSSSILGWIFVDYRNNLDIIDKNTIIYGHSGQINGLMFETLSNAIKEYWYSNSSNLIISFSIKGVEHKWKIFSIYNIAKTTDYLYINFNSDNAYMSFIEKIKNRSIYNFNEEVLSTDKILTLSTCYKDDSSRIVVHAKMIS